MAPFFPADRLDRAILATLAYADLFDFPLDRPEVCRDLVGVAATAAATGAALDRLIARGRVEEAGGFLTLPGRGALGAIRRERRARAAAAWPVARRYGALIARLPFVRLVGITGSLAAGNPDANADCDYLIITAPGRLWLVRALTIAIVRAARLRGVQLCPNYLLTTRALALTRRDLYTAHELLQIVPLAGGATYRRLIAENAWAADWLPNRYRRAVAAPPAAPTGGAGQRLGEAALGGALGDRIEGWEAGRKRRRFGRGDHGAHFTADRCEGHFGRARRRVLDDFARRCDFLGIAAPTSDDAALPPPGFVEAAGVAAGDK